MTSENPYVKVSCLGCILFWLTKYNIMTDFLLKEVMNKSHAVDRLVTTAMTKVGDVVSNVMTIYTMSPWCAMLWTRCSISNQSIYSILMLQ